MRGEGAKILDDIVLLDYLAVGQIEFLLQELQVRFVFVRLLCNLCAFVSKFLCLLEKIVSLRRDHLVFTEQ